MSGALSTHFAHDDLLPRAPGGLGPGAALAVLAHLGLLWALTASTQWRTQTPQVFSAELWGAIPEQAAPRPMPVAPPPPPRLAPTPTPPPVPKPPAPPPVPVPAPPPPPPQRDADIATEQARRAEAERQQQMLERARLETERLRAEAKAKRDAELAQKREDDAKRKREEQAQRKREAEAVAQAKAKAEAAQKAELEKRQRAEAERQALAKAKAEEAQLDKQREENLARMMGQADRAGPTGTGGTGTAAVSRAPSAAYVGRLIAIIKPNIVFTGRVAGNPAAEVEVRAAPGGTIISRKLVKSSGHADWDEAVLRAIDRTATLPLDADGRVPNSLVLVFRPGG